METCFVIMPIGDQKYDKQFISSTDLKSKYDDLLKECLSKVKPDLEIVRADEISMPGAITTDIFTRIMHSKYVLADITFPNPNVFYELGLRHAISNKTILIKEKGYNFKVFDISYLRFIEYENSATGLKELTKNLEKTFDWIDKNPDKTDNHFLELAALTKFNYPKFIDYEEIEEKKKKRVTDLFQLFIKEPAFLQITLDKEKTQEEKNDILAKLFAKKPELLNTFLQVFIEGGFDYFKQDKN